VSVVGDDEGGRESKHAKKAKKGLGWLHVRVSNLSPMKAK
jgi:hypothetical protein